MQEVNAGKSTVVVFDDIIAVRDVAIPGACLCSSLNILSAFFFIEKLTSVFPKNNHLKSKPKVF